MSYTKIFQVVNTGGNNSLTVKCGILGKSKVLAAMFFTYTRRCRVRKVLYMNFPYNGIGSTLEENMLIVLPTRIR